MSELTSLSKLQRPSAASLGKVAVLFGGVSAEREVSLKSGTMVLAALQQQGVTAIGFDPAVRGLHELKDEGVDRVFIALHGRFGEDGTVQGALELLGIPYTGSGVTASAVAMDKVLTKRLWASEGIPTPASRVLRSGDSSEGLERTLGLPLIVKPPHEGSTLGITKVLVASDIAEAVELALAFDTSALAEEFIEGPELTITLLELNGQVEALPVIEIRAPNGNYDFEHKYLSNATQYLCPAPFPEALMAQAQGYALAAFKSLGCSGWGRVDVMVRQKDQALFLLEINTSPGMTDHSLVPMAAKAAGLSYEHLVMHIAANASLKNKQIKLAKHSNEVRSNPGCLGGKV
jgi:D-alanine-D-alanine ligase